MNYSSQACITAFNLAYNLVFQASNYYQMIISFCSVFPLIYFLLFKLSKSSFHGNLKTIFISYFVSLVAFSMTHLTTSTTQIIKSIISTDNCDLIISPFPHKIWNFFILFFLTLSTFFPCSVTIERYFAMETAEKYEKASVVMGPILVGFNVLLNFCIIFNMLKDESYTDGNVSFSVIPAVAAQKAFTFFIIIFFVNLVDVIFDLILLRMNLKLKLQLKNSSLAVKYQLEEVYQSTKFSVFLILIHIISFGIYVSAVVFFRYFGNLIISDPDSLFGVRTFSTTIVPTYNFVIGSFSSFFNRIKLKKSEGATIQMSSTGKSGANNYDQAIFSIWNSVSGPIDRNVTLV
ncbi:Serpentine receptor class beta-11 [Caenorhabditis elegans]|uniref:Serpentine receptor class beta-11 n=1 Tax=Caenorhabditis elegans TaxID=6239 RepID=SRB11_CAEEL|nr:Serpentine receptor class beta-11 [Caenorhabditis elegans]P46506.2 RecName: Full=Serpentine receptor class beta-11; Short=Protein srb-11 [Caenorhabditis elegans]CCD69930.1 Serpentine receptor class beta-11 [Caenorhabditis elegans]|eukprot:NP_498430.2 Serpentine receptor class beta-11 [Caenorhabditis elegans]